MGSYDQIMREYEEQDLKELLQRIEQNGAVVSITGEGSNTVVIVDYKGGFTSTAATLLKAMRKVIENVRQNWPELLE